MYQGQKVIVVMPAYNAGRTVRRTHAEVIAQDYVDEVILVDDASGDRTVEIVQALPGVRLHRHPENLGYGANQKTCYRLALEAGGQIVIMVHPDYQYTPKLIPAMASLIGNGLYSCVIGSRVLGGYALRGGMPLWRYIGNRFLTAVENVLMGAKLSEYHSGYRAYSGALLERLPLDANSDDFVFDNQILAQVLWTGARIAEVSCPTRYFKEASSINFRRSVRYGLSCLATAAQYFLARRHWIRLERFPSDQEAALAAPDSDDEARGDDPSADDGPIALVERNLGYRFNDRAILETALTHRSHAHEKGRGEIPNYERLEFLGDSLLGCFVSDFLYRDDGAADEGTLSRRRQSVVRTETLARVARELELGDALRLGRGEQMTGGRKKSSLLADVFEAVLGAVYLDGGAQSAEALVRRHLGADLEAARHDTWEGVDHKTRLQERVQARLQQTPRYRIVSTKGPDHAREFVAEVFVGGDVLGQGEGTNRKRAEQEAARAALSSMGQTEE